MTTINPYQSPRLLDGQPVHRSPLGLRRVFPKYVIERFLVTFPLVPGLLFGTSLCLGGLARKMYFHADLQDGRTVVTFESPFWDEAAWASTCFLFAVLIVGLFFWYPITHSLGAARTRTERWLAYLAAFACSLPLLLCTFAEDRQFPWLLERTRTEVAVAISCGLFSALFQIWYWWNRRQAALAVFWALRSWVAFCGWIAG